MSSAVEVVPVEADAVVAPALQTLVDTSYLELTELKKTLKTALNPVVVSLAMLDGLVGLGYGHMKLADATFGPGVMTQLYDTMKQKIVFKPVGCSFYSCAFC